MRILAPSIKLESEADASLIRQAVLELRNKDNPYLILEKDDMTYAQAVWVDEKMDLEYQVGSIFEHFQSTSLLCSDDVISALISYSNGEKEWNIGIHFERKNIQGKSGSIGYRLGKFIGGFFRGSET